jgi:hypothetical protein
MRKFLRSERGSLAVEFAITAPILMLVLLGMAEMSLAVNERMRLASAVRAGVQAATLHPGDSVAVKSAVEKAAPELVAGRLMVSLSNSCGCADGSAIACGGTCAVGTEQRFVTVTIAETYPLQFRYPGLGTSLELAAEATMRY